MPQLKYWDLVSSSYLPLMPGPQGPPGPAGPSGPTAGLPAGGPNLALLQKKSATDYDTQWAVPAGTFLAQQFYAPGSQASYSTGTAAWQLIDTNNLSLAFTPLTGVTWVDFEMSFGIYATAASSNLFVTLFDHGTANGSPGQVVTSALSTGPSGIPLGNSFSYRFKGRWRLTPPAGTPYRCDVGWYSSSGTYTAACGGNIGAFIMTASVGA